MQYTLLLSHIPADTINNKVFSDLTPLLAGHHCQCLTLLLQITVAKKKKKQFSDTTMVKVGLCLGTKVTWLRLENGCGHG